ncbi:MAG: replicative DNA helicase [Bacillota bacterium]|nr:replicative DNA helicase [Bacillota bacterium]
MDNADFQQSDGQFIRRIPYNQEAEQSVLGSVFVNPDCLGTVVENLKVDEFYLQQNKQIFSAMVNLYERGEPVDIVTVSTQLGEALTAIGGYNYLANLAISLPTTENLKAYINIVKNLYLRRRLITAGNSIINSGQNEDQDLSSILDGAEKAISNIIQNKSSAGIFHVSDVMVNTFEQIEKNSKNKGKISGLSTGLSDLDNLTKGLQPSDLIIIAARPAMGKSSLAMNIAQHAAIRENKAVAVFNLEMSAPQLGNRILWSEAHIDGDKIRSGNLDGNDWPQIAKVIGKISRSPLYIDDTPGITVTEIRAKCKKLKLEHGLGLIIIDYLQLMQSGRKSDSRQQEISEISRSLKILAKELEIPVIALSQLSRATTSRTGNKPQLSDLRESGAIEQDADIVMFIHRPGYYDDNVENKNLAELIVAKHRNGPTETIPLMWRGETTTFVSVAHTEYNGG